MNSLSSREEETLLKATKANALRECDDIVKGMFYECMPCICFDSPAVIAFAACASGRTVSVAWECRGQLKDVQDCMVQL